MRNHLRSLKASHVVALVVGVALAAGAAAATQTWLDRHFLPSFLLARDWYVAIETSVRVLFACVGIALAVAALRASPRLTLRSAILFLQALVAVALALGASELALQRVQLRPTGWRILNEEPRRQPDARLGWKFLPSRTSYWTGGRRMIEYAFDRSGYRVRRADAQVDLLKPTIVCAGESVMFGDGLTYDETIPGQLEAMLGTQTANLGVYGFSTDQMYLNLEQELPKFRRPVAVVALFMTALFGRNLDDDRPHLAPGLVWQPAQEHSRLMTLAGLVVPFRRKVTVDNGIAMTREALRATVALAQARGANALIVVPQIGAESPTERLLRRRILEETQLPHVVVELDPAWHVARDRHPDARAARAIAAAIATRLSAGNQP